MLQPLSFAVNVHGEPFTTVVRNVVVETRQHFVAETESLAAGPVGCGDSMLRRVDPVTPFPVIYLRTTTLVIRPAMLSLDDLKHSFGAGYPMR